MIPRTPVGTCEYTPVKPPKLTARNVEYIKNEVMSPTLSCPEATCTNMRRRSRAFRKDSCANLKSYEERVFVLSRSRVRNTSKLLCLHFSITTMSRLLYLPWTLSFQVLLRYSFTWCRV